MNKKKQNIVRLIATTILFGAIWGFFEATAGYLLHWLPNLISGSIMFPIGAVLMFWAFQKTKRHDVIIYVGIIAAAIKAINFALPLAPGGYPKIYNPMISIILQSLSIFAASYFFKTKPNKVSDYVINLGLIYAISFTWRSLFLVNYAISYAATGFLANQISSAPAILSFILLNGLIELSVLAVIYIVYRLIVEFVQPKLKVKETPNWLLYVLSPLTLVIAILAVVIK
ncbi:MAG: hypothetical protein WCZ47_01095 [Bacilli bacterium]|jgi:hypothetical protein